MTPPATATAGRTLVELFDALRQRRVRLFLDDRGALRFKATKGAFTAELKAEVQERKAEIVDFLREVASGTARGAPTIEPVARDRPLPLSFSQERLWFFDRFEPGSALYNLLQAVELHGALDAAALDAALGDLIDRHEALRTVFVEVDEQPAQQVLPRLDLSLEIDTSVATASTDDRLAVARERAAELTARPFDLATGPLVRAVLLRVSTHHHVLVLVLHHIVSDGWSTGVMIRDLAAFYQARRDGMSASLPPLDVHYPDYAAWQRRQLRGERLDAELAHWRERLAGAPETLTLPLDRPRPARRSDAGQTLRFRVEPATKARLDDLAQRHGASLFMVLLAAYGVLLARLTNQRDLIVGTPIAGRHHPRIQELIGFFVNTLALRARLDGRPTFVELLARVRETTLDAYAHQDLPFEKLVEALQPERDLSRNAIFQTMMVLQNAPRPSLDLGALRLVPLYIDGTTAQCDLTLTWIERDGGLDAEMEFARDLFDRETIARWAAWQVRLLDAVVDAPELPIDRLPMLTPDEARQVRIDWALGPTLSAPSDAPLHETVARHAARTPKAQAVTDDDGRRLDYGTLDALADHLVARLHALDPHAAPEARVAVCLPRDLRWIVALLAIARAGRVVVPLDPAAPPARQHAILGDADARLLLTTAELAPGLRAAATASRIVEVEDPEAPHDPPPVTASPVTPTPVDPDQAAYVIYTSGSTGRPKGVAVTHRALARHVRGLIDGWSIGPDDRIFETASFAFDVSQEQTWLALASGASLHVRGDELWPADALCERFDAFGITFTDLPVVYWRQWVAEMTRAAERGEPMCRPAALRRISVGGEAMDPEAARRWASTPLGDVVLGNAYGPTEATVTAIVYDVPADFDRATVPVGSPLTERVARVLDRDGSPTPPGVVGELCLGDRLGGALLARGYLDRPRATAERFVPDPCGAVPGARLYRTGDLARFLADGRIDFLGRIDAQVKIRGFRVELGEIEAALAEHPAVREVAVVVDTTPATGARLLAYPVLDADAVAPTADDWRAFLRQRVPEYMVPAGVVPVDALPTTTSGKLDQRALPVPEIETARFEAPSTLTERRMAELWAETLDVDLDALSVHANFFDLGGHSLLATQLVTRAGRAFDVDLPLRTLFEAPTVRDLADEVDALRTAGIASSKPPLERAERDRPLPLSFSQERLWLFEQVVPGTPIYNTSRAGRLLGRFDLDAFERTFHELVRRHESLRTRYAGVPDGEPVQWVEPFEPRPIERVDLSHLDAGERPAEARRLAQAEADTPFDLDRELPIRCRILRLDDDDHVVLLSIHHVAYDIASGSILLYELETLYRAFVAGEPSPLPELTLHYPDFAAWQRAWLDDATLDEQLDYWRRQLAPVADPADAPRIQFADRARVGDGDFAGALYRFFVPGDLGARAMRAARERHVTQFMLHLTAFMGLLYRYAPQPHLLVGTAVSNRSGAEMQQVVGFFDNLLPLVAAWDDELSFERALDKVRDVALGAYAHQHVPFERLMREMRPERESRRVPLIQIVFLYLLDYPAMTREIAGLDMRPFDLDSESAKFDLTLALRDTDDGLVGQIEYDTGLFDAATIERLARHYEIFLGAALDAPDRPLIELPLLTADELSTIERWSRPAALAAPSAEAAVSVPERVARRAAESPDAVALVAEGAAPMTRGELSDRADAIAAALSRAGVGAEDRVVVCRRRDAGWIVALVAVWRTGAAYVPVDPAYPDERLRFILADTGAPLVLSDADQAPRFVEAEVPTWIVEADGVLIAGGEPADLAGHPPPVGRPDPYGLAYTIYTSGSTGTPKGVEITHGSLARLVDWHLDRFALGDADTSSHLAGQGFDASVWEIWPALAGGARLAMPAERRRADPEALRDWLAEQRVTTTFLPTPLAEALLTLDWPTHAPRLVLTGGDRLRRGPDRRTPFALINNYGPTESTVVATSGPVPAGDTREIGPPDIGRPIHGVRAHVLDRGLRPLPAGCPGELYLGGDQLARGYGRRPALTAERFVPDPFAEREQAGGRLYRTGDLVRWRRDGTLDFLGRLDEQVKIRGFRVELGEIEAALWRQPRVAAAALTAPERADGARQLVAFVEPAPDADGTLDLAAVERALGEILPAHMVPSRVVPLDALPTTANGKVDRRALDRHAHAVLDADSDEQVAPRNDAEATMAELWAELLDRPRPSIHDDFFALGGHSLLATRLVSRVRDVFGVELSMESVFDHPTVAGFTAVVDGARPIDASTTATSIASIELPPVDRGEPLALSPAQERIWFLDRWRPGDPAYTIAAAVRWTGPLDAEALGRAAIALVARHETLRTTFATDDDDAAVRARVHPADEAAARLDFARRELAAALDTDDDALRRRLADTLARPFSLVDGPLVRLRLFEHPDAPRGVLLWAVHHIVADGWSMGVFLRELAALYARELDPDQPTLPPLAVQYVDFAAAQRAWLRSDAGTGQLDHWRRRLADRGRPMALPTSRPPSSDAGGAIHRQALDPTLTAAVKALARREDASVFMVLAAALAGLFHDWGEDEVVTFGFPVAGRRRSELDGLIGMFLNTLVLDIEVADDPSPRERIARARRAVLDGDAHQDVPFETVLDTLRPDRDPRRTPLFQVMLNMLDFPEPPRRLGALRLEPLLLDEHTAKFDLTLYAAEHDGRLTLDWVYRTARFEAERVALMADQLAAILRADAATEITPSEDRPSDRAPRPAPTTRLDPPSVLDTIWRRAGERPERHALIDAGTGATWTYGDLASRSDELARRLVAAGVGRGDVVAIYAVRDAALVAALLGVWRAGAAFAVLDAAYPAARLAGQIRRATPAALVRLDAAGALGGEAAAALAATSRLEIALASNPRRSLDPAASTDLASTADAAIDLADRRPGPDDLAYVAFTSGSTGEPRAIDGTHAPLDHFVAWHVDTWGFGLEDRFVMLSGLAHDPLLRDVLTPLAVGAALMVPAPPTIRVPRALRAMLREQSVTVAHLTPSLLRLLTEDRHGDATTLDALRHVFTSGELLRVGDVERCRALAPDARVVNFYGATETPQGVAYHEVRDVGDRLDADTPIPLGRGIDGVELLVLDRDGRPAPPLVRGELVVRGAFLARGYRGDAAATAERFVSLDGVAAYRTGDLGRIEPSGEVVFLGRADRQVTVRGFRVEPGEVEQVLLAHPEVVEVVVAEHSADVGLTAWWVSADADAAPSADGLRAYAADHLPDYAVPSRFVWLDALPLTPNGKVDHRALPAPRPIERRDVAGRPPQSDVETTLAAIWRQLLDVDPVSVDDHFFALGGHSLMAVRLAARIHSAFGVECPLAAFFEAPTLGALADRIDALLADGGPGDLDPGPRAAERPPDTDLPLTFAQERLVFLERFQPGGTAFVLSAALQLDGEVTPDAVQGAFDDLLARHEILRGRFVEIDGEPRTRLDPRARVEVEHVDLRAFDPEAREREATRRRAEVRPLPLDRAPLLRARLLRLDDDRHHLLLDVHHLIADGWSMALLVGELATLYAARRAGRPPDLPPLAVQYADFAAWQRRSLRGDRLDAAVDAWRSDLAGLPPRLDLPTDGPRPRVLGDSALGDHAGRLPVVVDPSLVDGLRRLALDHGTTLFTVLAAATFATLGRHSGQRDIALGLPIAGRRFETVEPLVGLFADTLILRGDLHGNPALGELVDRVHRRLLDARERPPVPFERLVAELRPERSLGHAPIFQVLLAFQNVPRQAVELPELRLEWLDTEHASTSLDLEIEWIEDGDRLIGSWTYHAELFRAATVERLVDSFQRLLAAFVASPEHPWLDVPLVVGDALDTERLHATGRTLAAPVIDLDQPLGAAIFRVAADDPDRPAILGDDRMPTWSYGELVARADAIAIELSRRAVEAEQVIGVCMARGPEMVAALLGILRAGCAYLPLDPDYPAARLAFMLDDACGPSAAERWVLGCAAERAHRPALDATWVDIDRLSPAAPAATAVFPSLDGERLAYVIYTSGSTGRPKGVQIRHAAAVHFLASMADAPGLDADDVVAAVTTLSFDISVLEIFLPLSVGARLAIVDRATVADGDALARRLDAVDASVLQATPAGWRLLLEAGWRGRPRLRALCGGEALPDDLADALLARCAAVWNLYGPTETTVWSSVRRVEPGERPIRLGGPIASTTLRLLDGRSMPVPLGVVGEVYLGGRGLARGYLGRPRLTAERFVPDPFATEPGARLYRVGDLARRRDDGTLEFLGRADDQTKVRGYRIEPGEIEAVLARAPAVERAAVIARRDQLVAYLVLDAEALEPGAPDAEGLDAARDHCRAELPAHMIPHRWLVLDALPLTPSGKIDRRALPDPRDAASADASPGEPPRDALEQQLAALWCQVLEIDTVSRDDDFFALGGHSLLAMRLVAAIHHETGRQLPVRDLFLAPTPARLADRLRAPESSDRGLLVPLAPILVEDATPWICIHGVAGGVGNYAELARALADQRPVYGIEAPDDLASIDSLEALAERYHDAIRRHQPRGPLHLLGWSMGGVVAFEIARLEERAQGSIERLVLIDSTLPRTHHVEERDILLAFADDIGPTLDLDLPSLAELDDIVRHDLDTDEIIRRLTTATTRPDHDPTDLQRLYRRYRERFRANWRLLATYRPRRVEAPAILYRAEERARDPAGAASWRHHLVNAEMRSLPGSHGQLLEGDALRILAAMLRI